MSVENFHIGASLSLSGFLLCDDMDLTSVLAVCSFFCLLLLLSLSLLWKHQVAEFSRTCLWLVYRASLCKFSGKIYSSETAYQQMRYSRGSSAHIEKYIFFLWQVGSQQTKCGSKGVFWVTMRETLVMLRDLSTKSFLFCLKLSAALFYPFVYLVAHRFYVSYIMCCFTLYSNMVEYNVLLKKKKSNSIHFASQTYFPIWLCCNSFSFFLWWILSCFYLNLHTGSSILLLCFWIFRNWTHVCTVWLALDIAFVTAFPAFLADLDKSHFRKASVLQCFEFRKLEAIKMWHVDAGQKIKVLCSSTLSGTPGHCTCSAVHPCRLWSLQLPVDSSVFSQMELDCTCPVLLRNKIYLQTSTFSRIQDLAP